MINLHPETDLNQSIMVLGARIIEKLKKDDGYIFIEKLMTEFLDESSERTPEMFIHSISFLYLFEIIERKGYKIRLKTNKNNQTELFDD